MTVCISAVCQFPGNLGSMIIGCSDRMLTLGATEYQPAQAKFYQFATAPNVITLVAGNISPAIVICDATNRRLLENPSTKTRLVAEICADEYANHQRHLAQREVLDPLGLTHARFLADQRKLDPEFIRRTANDMISISVGVEIMIAGQDDEGAHIYVIRDRAVLTGSELAGTQRVEDPVGFAAIGIGATHAYSQFTLANYDRRWPLGRALFLLYSARRRAQVAPGVGEDADWFFVSGGKAERFNNEIIAELDKQYKRAVRADQRVRARIDAHMEAYFAARFKSPQPTAIAPVESAEAGPSPSGPDAASPPPSPSDPKGGV